MIKPASSNKDIILGTALWGWGITRTEAFKLLEGYFDNGGTIVDTATNYPINKCQKDFGLAIRWLEEWTRLNPDTKYSLMVKLGSKNNLGGPEVDLGSKNIYETTDRLKDSFESSLSCISIHWDNRVAIDKEEGMVRETVEAMSRIRETGLDIGLSGISEPKLYYLASPDLANEWVIQVKENFLTNQARLAYEKYFPHARYFAYGINMGGLKLEDYSCSSSIRLRGIEVDQSIVDKLRIILNSSNDINPNPKSLNQLSLAFTHSNEALSGVIIGPRNINQLEDTFRFWNELEKSDNRAIWSYLFQQAKKGN